MPHPKEALLQQIVALRRVFDEGRDDETEELETSPILPTPQEIAGVIETD